jgi:hypothetical protein
MARSSRVVVKYLRCTVNATTLAGRSGARRQQELVPFDAASATCTASTGDPMFPIELTSHDLRGSSKVIADGKAARIEDGKRPNGRFQAVSPAQRSAIRRG